MLSQITAMNFELLPPEVELDLNVAVFFDTVTCSVSVAPQSLASLTKLGIGLEISCYPTRAERDELERR